MLFMFHQFIVDFILFGFFSPDIRSVLNDDNVYNAAASEAFPLYNKSHLMCLKMPGKSEDVSLYFRAVIIVFSKALSFL